MQTQVIEVKAPFTGAYKCALAEADLIQDELHENEQGQIVTKKVPYKKIVGLLPQRRLATKEDQEAIKAGRLYAEGNYVYDSTEPTRLTVPAEFAQSLVARGLAEIVAEEGKKKLKAPV